MFSAVVHASAVSVVGMPPQMVNVIWSLVIPEAAFAVGRIFALSGLLDQQLRKQKPIEIDK